MGFPKHPSPFTTCPTCYLYNPVRTAHVTFGLRRSICSNPLLPSRDNRHHKLGRIRASLAGCGVLRRVEKILGDFD